MVVRLNGKLVCEKNNQLVINLTDADFMDFNIKTGVKVKVEFESLEKWDDD